ncbi:MAG: hypothetical protein II759_00915 [Lachnospiraceae bacterium]|nr:hypothetical protein [Lachnospiraceae bacterium]
MKIQYIGTGAAEGFPGMYCGCGACRRALKAGGRNLKTRSCTLLNDSVLIDISPDIHACCLEQGITLHDLKALVVTHTHDDHLDRYSFILHANHGASIYEDGEESAVLHVYGSVHTAAMAAKFQEGRNDVDPSRIEVHEVGLGEWFDAGGLKFFPLKANHMKDELCYIYAVTDGEKNILYANDTGKLPQETLDAIERLGLVFDLVSMDCARGTLTGDGHMSFAEDIELKNWLKEKGLVHGDTQFWLNHFAHMCGLTHDEAEELMAPEGMHMTYDGLTAEL